MSSNVDLHCQAILRGLQGLETVLDRPLANRALELGIDVNTSQNRDLLIRLRKSLVQYVERSGSLFYAALIGHFSSGKSSTINSLLGLRGTSQERDEDWHPTDQVITLITHSKNGKSILGIVQGSIPIKIDTVDDDLLSDIVLADTPGTGDPQLREAIARDFLPVCDVVLFFFSATSPLDTTDIPLLSELHERLPFIPIMFVITRADELRVNRNAPVSESNFDTSQATSFLASTMSRVNQLLEPGNYAAENFILIDNKVGFHIAELKHELVRRAEPTNLSARFALHSHKVHYFQTTAEKLRDFFSSFIDAKLSELARIVSGADRNIQKYQEGVNISNTNLTKSWFDDYSAIQELRDKTGDRIRTLRKLPASMTDSDSLITAAGNIKKDISTTATHVADVLRQHAERSGLSQLKREFSRIQKTLTECELDSLSPNDHGLAILPLEWAFGSAEIVPTHRFARNIDDFRESKRRLIITLVGDVKRGMEEMLSAIQQRAVIDKCEGIVNAAQVSLERDLDQYFQSVEVYRAGVFALQTKASIAKLGVGEQLDQLETEFTEEDKDAIKRNAKNQLFPSFAETTAAATTDLTAVSDQIRKNVEVANQTRVETPPSLLQEIENREVTQLPNFISQLKDALQEDANDFVTRMQSRIAAIIGGVLNNYSRELRAAQTERRRSYILAIGGLGLLFLIGYLGYSKWLSQQAGQSRLEVLLWGLAANAIGAALGFAIAKWRDHYPQTKTQTKQRQLAALTEQVRLAVEEAFKDFSVVQTPILSSKLEALYSSVTSPPIDAWQTAVEDQYAKIRKVTDDFEELRKRYITVVDKLASACGTYFEDHNRNLQELKSTAQSIKEQAIEPSFRLLEDTSTDLRAVMDEIKRIKFI